MAGGLAYCTAEYNVLSTYEDYLNDSTVDDVSKNEFDRGDFKVYAFHMRFLDSESEKCECASVYEATYQNIQFRIDAYYSKKNRDKAIKELDKIAESVEYISDYKVPTETQTFDTEFISVNYEPIWYAGGGKTELDDDGYGEVARYSFHRVGAENNAQAMSLLKMSVSIEPEEDTPVVIADRRFENLSNNERYENVQRGQEKIFGFDAERVSFESRFGSTNKVTLFKNYYFEHNGYI